jgi:hypothetical protein
MSNHQCILKRPYRGLLFLFCFRKLKVYINQKATFLSSIFMNLNIRICFCSPATLTTYWLVAAVGSGQAQLQGSACTCISITEKSCCICLRPPTTDFHSQPRPSFPNKFPVSFFCWIISNLTNLNLRLQYHYGLTNFPE